MPFPYILDGKVYDTDGTTALSNIKVTARNERTNEAINNTTNALGEYVLDCANFASGYAEGDIISLFVIYTNYEDYEEHTIVAGGGATINLTLVIVPASDNLRYFTVQDFYDFFHLTAGNNDIPTTNEVVKTGLMVESGIDEECSTRFSDGNIITIVDDCDATTSWSGSTDATAIGTDTATYRTRTASLKLGKSGVTEAFFNYSKTMSSSLTFQNKVVGCFVKFSSLSGLATTGTAVRVIWGTDGSNYYYKDYEKSDLIADWNFLYFKSTDDDVYTVGTPTLSSCSYFMIYITTTAITDTFTTGTILLDYIFLVHEDHFQDEYLNTRDEFQDDYFVSRTPIDKMLYFMANTADEESAETWSELTEVDDEIDLTKDIGRIRIRDIDIEDEENIRPQPGVNQVRAVYTFGKSTVPKDIKKLSILMVGRDLMHSAVSRAIFRGQDSFKTDHYTVLDSQIDSLIGKYRMLDMVNV